MVTSDETLNLPVWHHSHLRRVECSEETSGLPFHLDIAGLYIPELFSH